MSLWEYANPKKFMQTSGALLPWVSVAAAACLIGGLVWGFFFTPDDYKQGATVKIIYLHVPADAEKAWETIDRHSAILEGFVTFAHEFSVLLVRGIDGETRFWDSSVNVHKDGILATATLPPPQIILDQQDGRGGRLTERFVLEGGAARKECLWHPDPFVRIEDRTGRLSSTLVSSGVPERAPPNGQACGP